MEADVEPSRETEERLRAEEEAKQQQEAQLAAELAAREAEEAAERDQAAAQALANQQRMQVSSLNSFHLLVNMFLSQMQLLTGLVPQMLVEHSQSRCRTGGPHLTGCLKGTYRGMVRCSNFLLDSCPSQDLLLKLCICVTLPTAGSGW